MTAVPKNVISTLDEIRDLKGQKIYAAINIWGSMQFIFEELVVGDLYDLRKSTSKTISHYLSMGLYHWAFFNEKLETNTTSYVIPLDSYAPFGYNSEKPEIEEELFRRCVLVREKEHLEEWQMYLAMVIDADQHYDLECQATMRRLKTTFNLKAGIQVFHYDLHI